ncbi:carboxylesterase/lipase family protein [Sphingomonas sp. NFR15]|uniref:carboxylesterase/lipase family protein n=1 Tax=Sphingomonas sp. NFR15 TaxID=1566282 RepID=UPI00088854DF|nr:carboxylesterase family protein [Sphingomonas sp. NFR15]SDA35587.1 para-nitrobenzyl esterase [Sphingomonas sp. NFR15]
MKVRLLTLLAGFVGSAASAAPVVNIAQGRLEGTTTRGVSVFKAIPYAAPPVGDLRWRAPQPPRTWPGVRAATAFGPVCPQAPVGWAGHDLDRTSEDCLTLNVWTPRMATVARLPVLVWFHGGGYTAGAGSQRTYEGSTLARQGVVIVTINYRLGVFGYLAHPALSKESPYARSGNYGLLDQIAALRWVRANIAKFGGDPANVTVSGQSAGGGSAMLVTVSPLARGLFRKAIFESGAALGIPGAGSDVGLASAEQAGVAFAQRLHAGTIAQLRAMPAAALIATVAPRIATAPIRDGKIVPLDITAAYRSRRDAGVPVLLGWNSNEAARFRDGGTLADYLADTRQTYPVIAPELLRLYPANSDATAPRAARNLMSDISFGWRSWSIAEARAIGGTAPVFLYQFDNPPPRADGSRSDGAVHSDELDYVWGNHDPARRWTAADTALAGVMQRYWVTFMRNGDPNGPGLPRWAPYAGGRTALWFRPAGLKNARPLRAATLRALDQVLHNEDNPRR